MSNLQNITSKIYSLSDLKIQSDKWKENGEKIVFTNGCFDLVHRGHVEVLANTADLGDRLIIGLNSDVSIQKIKGKN
ncbi:MAG: adenylyltransferase/cytidyltransferase family protein, partial [Flavobacteriales bacterium]|nr:adenylyltransferase/cytidyltransferase family protein [Flavobacteriales bacterium]